MKTTGQSLLASALLGAGLVQGAVRTRCPDNQGSICYSIGVPTSSASSNSGNIYFQIKAPTSFQWVALGTGTRMSDANIFLMYQDGNGNLTLSPRRGTQHTPPSLDTSSTAARLTLLAGSGVSNGVMTANIACANCQSWSAGSMALDSTDSSWVAAWKSGGSMATTNRGAAITQHDDTFSFGLDLTVATIAQDSNPFVGSTGNGNDNGGSGSNGNAGDTGNSSDGFITRARPSQTILVAHGVIMALVMAVLYPLGSILMPLLKKWWVHAIWQSVSWILMWAAFALGYQAARERLLLYTEVHTIMGTVVVACFGIQPVLGQLHHQYYLKHGGRGAISYIHLWWGRVLMVLGVVNGGLGLRLVGESSGPIIAYSVVSGAFFLAYLLYKGVIQFSGKKNGNTNGVGKVSGRY